MPNIKGFYYRNKKGDISVLNTSNLDVPDAVTSAQLEEAKNLLQQQIDQKLEQSDVSQIIVDVSDVASRLQTLEGKTFVESTELENLATVAQLEEAKTERTEVLNTVNENLQTSITTVSDKVDTLETKVLENTSVNDQQTSEIGSMKSPVANITAILDRLTVLEGKVEAIRHADVEVPEIPEEATTDNKGVTSKTVSSETEVIIKDIQTDTDKFVVQAKAVELKDVKSENNTVIINSQGDVTISGMENSGTLARTVSNAQVSLQSDEYVKITDSKFGQDGYNIVEIGLSGTTVPPKNVIIDNCDFTKVSNNAILVFGMQDDGVVTISNCHFGNVSNCIRYSNRTNSKNVTFNFVNCSCDHWDVDPTWAGFMICQDYTSGTKEEENNLFAPEKVKVNFINCSGPYGKINTENYGTDQAHYAGNAFTDDDGVQKQLVFVWNSKGGTLPYDKSKFPKVTLA